MIAGRTNRSPSLTAGAHVAFRKGRPGRSPAKPRFSSSRSAWISSVGRSIAACGSCVAEQDALRCR